eukprot:203573-Chlamydomonas_euryale.AAC.2
MPGRVRLPGTPDTLPPLRRRPNGNLTAGAHASPAHTSPAHTSLLLWILACSDAHFPCPNFSSPL